MDTVRAHAGAGQLQMLQWGHALSGMDTVPRLQVGKLLSMQLQWGHALSGMDTIRLKK